MTFWSRQDFCTGKCFLLLARYAESGEEICGKV
jgi:hypothetical protein